MSRDQRWADPSVIDVYRRESHARIVESRHGAPRGSLRHERGVSVRRAHGAENTLEAWSEPPSGAVACPDDPSEIAALNADLIIVQSAAVSIEVETRSGFVGSFMRNVTVTVLGVRHDDKLLSSVSITTEPDVAEAKRDLERLRRAQTLARTASARSPASARLTAGVAATLLAELWTAHAGRLLRPDNGARLEDHGRVGGGPFGAPFDDVGEETQLHRLDGADRRDGLSHGLSLGRYRPSFSDPPVEATSNLRLVPPAGPSSEPDVEILAIEHRRRRNSTIVFTLLGVDRGGQPSRCVVELSLDGFLAALTGGGRELFWTTGSGAVGSPWLSLALDRQLSL